ncbi:hypothetical protein FNV43_RR21948 [Rhamnella rubrinervis]|uniref:Phytocyanin domain-containing protein n=1 Tax=Rhamnella rubrinervis TaxID=2594499 RepID=A0A8K0GRL6_9ROSA|nr:hypothetical protein FNV43_RR21948 [Rhamnella rubrinervis]
MAAFVFSVTLLALSCVCFGAEHHVGDSAGWTNKGVSYDHWAYSKIFQVGDTLVFTYKKQMHNVMQVSREAFETCNSSVSPIAVYNSSSDSIPLQTPGDWYFICGVPGHCQAGMRLAIKVSALPSHGTDDAYMYPSSASPVIKYFSKLALVVPFLLIGITHV